MQKLRKVKISFRNKYSLEEFQFGTDMVTSKPNLQPKIIVENDK